MMVMVMMVVMGCNNGVLESEKIGLEKKNSFLDSLVKIGEGFQEIFASFGNVIGDVLGFTVVKYTDNRSEVGKHFENVGKGLKSTKDKLDELSKQIVSASNADTKGVEAVIQGTSAIITKLITSVTKLSGTVGNTEIADGIAVAGSAPAEEASVKSFIEEVRSIIDIADKSDVKIEKGNAGAAVANGDGPKAVVHNAQAGAGDTTKLAGEVAKADPWAMIDKIKNATTKNAAPAANDNAGQLATATDANNANGTAATNADLAAAVALKAMIKGGKFNQPAQNEDGALKAAAVSAVNKVLGILDIIIKKTVESNLDKIREAVKGIKYSESGGTEASQSDATQSVVTK
ncbi:variable large family protein [Borrelia hispanica]|uniref:variable large family protein n=1 Tax=Borrelia hispanica TaxID=40835 RepID=UPI000687BE5B|nr:variable large family protein [Borrelia hispanica]